MFCGWSGGDCDGVCRGVSLGDMINAGFPRALVGGGESRPLVLLSLDVMYKFIVEPVGEFGLDFLCGCVNSKFNSVSEAGFGNA